jgi:hypothetical protein
MPTLTIEVTEKDIDKGMPCDGWNDPISRALFRIVGQRFIVHEDRIHPLGQAGVFIPLPQHAKLWLWGFDHRLPVNPFSFKLEMPQ